MPQIDPDTKMNQLEDFSGGIQRKSSRFQQKDNELMRAENVSYDEIGGIGKAAGYTIQGSALTTTTTTSTSTSTTTTSTSSSTSTSTSTSTTTTA